jgi:hypothetical protein
MTKQGLYSKHFIFFVSYEWVQKVGVCVPGRLYNASLMFVVRPVAYPIVEHLKGASLS